MLDLKLSLLYINHDNVKITSIMIILMMICENTIFHDFMKIFFNLLEERSRDVFMKVEPFGVDMEKKISNIERTARTEE